MADERLHALMDGVRTGQLSRREFMRRAAVLGLSGTAIAAFLAACGASATATPAAGRFYRMSAMSGWPDRGRFPARRDSCIASAA